MTLIQSSKVNPLLPSSNPDSSLRQAVPRKNTQVIRWERGQTDEQPPPFPPSSPSSPISFCLRFWRFFPLPFMWKHLLKGSVTFKFLWVGWITPKENYFLKWNPIKAKLSNLTWLSHSPNHDEIKEGEEGELGWMGDDGRWMENQIWKGVEGLADLKGWPIFQRCSYVFLSEISYTDVIIWNISDMTQVANGFP